MKRSTLFLIAKILFAAAVMFFLFRKVDGARLLGILSHAALPPILLGILLILITVVIAGWRWNHLLGIFGILIPVGPLIAIAQIGQFFMMFLPGPTGDDGTRMVYISRLASGRVGEACATVLFDRLIGLSSVLALALFCIPFRWHTLASAHETSLLADGILILGAGIWLCGILFFLIPGAISRRFFEAILRFFPGHKLHDELVRMTGLLCTNKPVLARVVAAAAGTQLLLCATYWLAGVSIGIHVSPAVWFSFVPIVIAGNIVPTIAGIGVREYLLVLFLGLLADVPRELALAASFIVLGMTVIVCLTGGLVYIVYRPATPAASLPDEKENEIKSHAPTR
jgi:uncharacterized membrane protein YbhN (UPF0104 family)